MTLLEAIRRRDYLLANKLVTELFQQKVSEAFDRERVTVLNEAEAPPMPVGWDKGWTYPYRIGAGGKETPYLKDGKWKLYVYNMKTGKHEVYDFASDMFEEETKYPIKEAQVYKASGFRDGMQDELAAYHKAYFDAYYAAFPPGFDHGNEQEMNMVNQEIAATGTPEQKKRANAALDASAEIYRKAEKAGEAAASKFDSALKKKWTELYGKDMAGYIKKRIAQITKANGGKKPTLAQLKTLVDF